MNGGTCNHDIGTDECHVPVLLMSTAVYVMQDGQVPDVTQMLMNVNQILASMECAVMGLGQICTPVHVMQDGVGPTAMQMLLNVHLILA